MSEQQDSETKGQYRYPRGFSTNKETFPQSEGQLHGTDHGFIEAQPASDNEDGSRSTVPDPRYKHSSQTDNRTVT